MKQLLHGDCLEVLRTIGNNSIDSIVTDPPYGLSFMGKRWDYDVPSVNMWQECLRVLKPGGYLLAFAGTRTQHRMAVRIEDAGFEIRDMIAWVYGSGFPKSHNGDWGGTALKPALEPITMARKPLIGTVEANWLTHGTGALNIDVCRVDGGERPLVSSDRRLQNNTYGEGLGGSKFDGSTTQGRWPANLIHDGSEEVLAGFPYSKSTGGDGYKNSIFAGGKKTGGHGLGDEGSAARFFYCAKASKKDRDAGCEDLPEVLAMRYGEKAQGPLPQQTPSKPVAQRNHHPTVKPTDLMRYLCRLVTPPSGIVLDPFMGSGSTGKAARLEGFKFVGIEREKEYLDIALARIDAVDNFGSCVDKSSMQGDLLDMASVTHEA